MGQIATGFRRSTSVAPPTANERMQWVTPAYCVCAVNLSYSADDELPTILLKGTIMARDEDGEDTTVYKVVVNHEEQYSIWPADRENALGWNDGGKSGSKTECLAYIKEVWTDMRPRSLREKMAAAEKDR